MTESVVVLASGQGDPVLGEELEAAGCLVGAVFNMLLPDRTGFDGRVGELKQSVVFPWSENAIFKVQ